MSGMFKIFPGGFTAFFKTAFAFGFRGRPFLVPTRIPVPPMAFQPSVYFCISSLRATDKFYRKIASFRIDKGTNAPNTSS